MKWILPEESSDNFFSFLLSKRNINDIDGFLNPTLDQIHSPTLLLNIDKAIDTILGAVRDKKKILIHGDFDADGITATSIMWDFLYRRLGADVVPYIPSRFDEGYGLSDESIGNIIEAGGELIITVDCGVKDVLLVEKYKEKIDFLITDHHTLLNASEVADEIQDKVIIEGEYAISKYAKAVVHPKLGDYPFKEVCGAVVSWKVCKAISKYLTNNSVDGIIYDKNFDANSYLELAALGTVCDVMPLIDENRAIVKLGLDKMKNSTNPGINALFEIAGSDIKEASTYHLGYIIGPRLNAAGRLETAMGGVRLLSTSSEEHARQYAGELNELNIRRQNITKEVYEEAEAKLDKQDKHILVYGENWPEGIIGLIAGKLSQKYNKPTFVCSYNTDEGILKGSARSPGYLNLAETLKELDSDLLRHGGHAGAAGFSLDYSALNSFSTNLKKYIDEEISQGDIEETLSIDGVIALKNLDFGVIEKLNLLQPFGYGNAKPTVALMGCEIIDKLEIGRDKTHLKFIVKSESSPIEAIGFNFKEKFKIKDYSTLDLAGYLDINEWNGNRKINLILKDVRATEFS
ncbi:MAG: single-stranded-DNA-specific exonuclease RecJ [Candidatus Dojkabacteria bacterium]|nr:single-stranded-DNA-specific exonuclease RecJ [Candidatus Dojkabacteria bacterium]MDQ7021036.1 single-stranded-DNA-specific exonuclease RecJ [Candidatus Dojkabacteria bacterium]